jgi:hypothetical protein
MGSRGGYACVHREHGGATTACCVGLRGLVFAILFIVLFFFFFFCWFNRKYVQGTHVETPAHENNVKFATENPEGAKLWALRP